MESLRYGYIKKRNSCERTNESHIYAFWFGFSYAIELSLNLLIHVCYILTLTLLYNR